MGSRDYNAGSRPGHLAISADSLWKYGIAVDAGIDVQSVAEATAVAHGCSQHLDRLD